MLDRRTQVPLCVRVDTRAKQFPRRPLELEDRAVRQGFVEESNVNTVSTMVDMISVQRAYANAAKAITTLDAIRVRKAVRALLAGGEHHEGRGWATSQPTPA